MKNIMSIFTFKRKLALIPVLALVIIFSSCEKKVIDLAPYSSISESTAFSTPSLIALAVTGMYNAAELGYYANPTDPAYRGYPFGAAFVEQGDCRGEDVVNNATFYQLTYTATYDRTSANNVNYWKDCYRLINRTNIVIEGVNSAVAKNIISAAQGNIYLGEARFFRAITHLELLFHFARPYKYTADASHMGVPFRDKAYTTLSAIDSGTIQHRNTVADCYAKILADLNFAETNLPAKSTLVGNAKIVRASKGAAVAYKTRVYQHMWNWASVIAEAQKMIAYTGNDAYSLTADPNTPFTTGYSNTESIFSIENSSATNPGTNAALARMYNSRQLVNMSPIIWRNLSWLADDKRRNATATSGMVYITASGVVYTNKYKDVTNLTDPAPVIRYAEVLLNLAEAYCRNASMTGAPDATALTYLNMVRNRSLATPATQAYTAASFADNTALLGAILTERRIEFVCEGRRWPDIHRLQNCQYFPINGIPAKLANAMPTGDKYTLGTAYPGPFGVAAIPGTDYRFLWPIPQSEVDINPTLAAEQNPGW
jgi:starch-binding outer membrane protein, SusD/RagB family